MLLRSLRLFGLYLCICIPATLFASTQPVQSTTYMGFNPKTRQNNLQQGIAYQFPDPAKFGNGPYPLFVWTPGTLEPYQDIVSLNFVLEMANRGFVGASVQYSNTNTLQRCSDYAVRAKSIFDATQLTSAVGVLCSVAGVSCSQGIVTAGISQGAALSIMAKNYAPSVKATYAMSISDYNLVARFNLSSCLDDQYTAIPADRLTIVNGESDVVFGGQTPLMNVSGYTCPTGTLQCWSPTGSGAGWIIIQDTQVTDGDADHCYEVNGGCTTPTTYDWDWYLNSYNWSLRPNLNWLASFGTTRVFSSTGQ